MEYKKKYLDRNPRIGDNVVCTSNPFGFGGYKVGYEYTITKLGNGYIVVTGNRMPASYKEITIHDGHYVVFELVAMEPPKTPKETHVKEYKLFGITVMKRTLYIYDESA